MSNVTQEHCNERHAHIDTRYKWMKWSLMTITGAAIAASGAISGAVWNSYTMASDANHTAMAISDSLGKMIAENRKEVIITTATVAALAKDRERDLAINEQYRRGMQDAMESTRSWLKTITENQQQVLRKQDVMGEQINRLLKKVDDGKSSGS